MTLLAVAQSKINSAQFALFDDQQTMHLYDRELESVTGSFGPLYTIQTMAKGILIDLCEPYVYIAERYGSNAVVINLETSQITPFIRDGHNADVSSFAIAFVKTATSTLLFHQTSWNKMNLTDLSNNHCLTERPPFIRQVCNEQGELSEESNQIDYFLSLLHISPNAKSFLVNGWEWGPVDCIRCGTLNDFLQAHELSTLCTDYSHGYHWDRPATFIDDDCFVMAVDDPDPDMMDEEDRAAWPNHQLRFYRLSDKQNDQSFLTPFKLLAGDWFAKQNGEVNGKLYYDSNYEVLVAMSQVGIVAIDLAGNTLAKDAVTDGDSWQYNVDCHQFYALQQDKVVVMDYSDWFSQHALKQIK